MKTKHKLNRSELKVLFFLKARPGRTARLTTLRDDLERDSQGNHYREYSCKEVNAVMDRLYSLGHIDEKGHATPCPKKCRMTSPNITRFTGTY